MLCSEICLYIEKRLREAFLPVDLPEQRCWWGGKAPLLHVLLLWARLIREMLNCTFSLLLKPSQYVEEWRWLLESYIPLHDSIFLMSDFLSELSLCLRRVITMSRWVCGYSFFSKYFAFRNQQISVEGMEHTLLSLNRGGWFSLWWRFQEVKGGNMHQKLCQDVY